MEMNEVAVNRIFQNRSVLSIKFTTASKSMLFVADDDPSFPFSRILVSP